MVTNTKLQAEKIPFYAFTAPAAPAEVAAPSAQDLPPFSARNRPGAPSAPEFGCVSARQAVGILFRAENDTFFMPGADPEHLLRRIWGIFMPGRRANPRKYLCSTKKTSSANAKDVKVWADL